MEKNKEKPKKKNVVKYVARFASYFFGYNIIDPKTGKPMPQKDHKGNELFSKSGSPIYITAQEMFTTQEDKMSRGFLSYYIYDKDDKSPQNLEKGRALEFLANKPDPDVQTEDAYQKSANFAAWKEKQKVKDLTDKVSVLEQQLEELKGKK